MFDPVTALENIYRYDLEPNAWLRTVAETLRPALDGGFGATAFTMNPALEYEELIGVADDKLDEEAIVKLVVAVHQQPELRKCLLRGRPGVYQASVMFGPAAKGHLSRLGMYDDSLGLLVQIGDGRLLSFGFGVRDGRTVDQDALPMWDRIVAHLGAGRRLLERDVTADAEAILTPGGKVEDAKNGELIDEHGETLKEAVKSIDKARTRSHRRDADTALALWHVLCAGRWSIVEHFESDGRRYLIACANDPDTPGPRELSKRQRQVVFYASLGWGLKQTGYALGLSESTVSTHLKAALERLGLESRGQLVQLFGTL